MAEVLQEVTTTLGVLEKSVSGTREYHLICRQPLIYAHVFNKEELSANSSVSISAWDKLARISDHFSSVPLTLPDPIQSIDFRPLLMDNVALREEGLVSPEFSDALSGKTPSVDCQEYTYERTQYGLNWRERVWTHRLFWVLKKKERELQVQVCNVSQDGQHWEDTLADVLKTSKIAVNATPFKGVTDILLLGKTNAMTVLVRDDEIVGSTWNCREKIGCNTLVVEIGLGAPVRVECPNYQGMLPNKLGELLSSMYLIGAALSLKKPGSILFETKVYGWLILRSQFNLGIELKVSTDKPEVKIMFISSNFNKMNQYFYHLYKFIV